MRGGLVGGGQGEGAAAVGVHELAHQVQRTAGDERAREQQNLAVAGGVRAGVEVERGLSGAGVRVRGRVAGGEGQEDGGVVGEPAADARQVVHDVDAGGAQVVGWADPGPQEQVRGADGAPGEHDLAPADDRAVGQPDADGTGAVEHDPLGVDVAADGERLGLQHPAGVVSAGFRAPRRPGGELERLAQVGQRRVDPHAVDGVARHQPRARRPARVLVGLGGEPAGRGGGQESLRGRVAQGARGSADRHRTVPTVAGTVAEVRVGLGTDVARQQVRPGPAGQPGCVGGGGPHPDRAVDRPRAAEDPAAWDVGAAAGAQLDRMRPVGGVPGHGGGEGGDVEDLRRPTGRTGLQQEHPTRAGGREPPGQRAAGRPAPDDHDVVLLPHGFRMAASIELFSTSGWCTHWLTNQVGKSSPTETGKMTTWLPSPT